VGVALVFVTARPPRWVDHLAGIAGVHGTMICANGAFTYDVTRRAVIRAHGMPPAVARAIAADLRQALPGIGFAAELTDGMHVPRSPTRLPEVWRRSVRWA
jgi:hydroxymethylpyrimidine pyrophosphatase-like HAD family hydrolase